MANEGVTWSVATLEDLTREDPVTKATFSSFVEEISRTVASL